jgi:hypothetical protein
MGRIKTRTIRQAAWLTEEEADILERVAYMTSLNRAQVMRMAMLKFARERGVFFKEKPTRKASRRPK